MEYFVGGKYFKVYSQVGYWVECGVRETTLTLLWTSLTVFLRAFQKIGNTFSWSICFTHIWCQVRQALFLVKQSFHVALLLTRYSLLSGFDCFNIYMYSQRLASNSYIMVFCSLASIKENYRLLIHISQNYITKKKFIGPKQS